MAKTRYAEYEDGKVHEVQHAKPETLRAGLYLYARRNNLKAVSYINWKTMPQPTLVFALGAGPLPDLPGKPKRGRPNNV